MSTNLAAGNTKKQKQLNNVIGNMLGNLQGAGTRDENQEFINTINKVKQDMLDAQCYFDSVTAPDLVDHAIFKMEAARAQYIYLLKLAKDKGLSVRI
ncbi:MAG TPA: YaaL family protein [Clostridia bacterium]|nr:YaaL family protein [Clostridia bacterium]